MAGVYGIERVESAAQWTAIPGLACERYHVNDSVVAHAGALCFRPGIVAVAGSGSIVLGITGSGRQICNHDFGHHSDAPSYMLAMHTLARILAGDTPDADLLHGLLAHVEVRNLAALRDKASGTAQMSREEHFRLYSGLAPLITQAAHRGCPVARAVCDRAAESLTIGVRIVGNAFESGSVSYALIGSVDELLTSLRCNRHSRPAASQPVLVRAQSQDPRERW